MPIFIFKEGLPNFSLSETTRIDFLIFFSGIYIYFPYIRSHTTSSAGARDSTLKVFDTLPIYQPQEVYRIFAVEMEARNWSYLSINNLSINIELLKTIDSLIPRKIR